MFASRNLAFAIAALVSGATGQPALAGDNARFRTFDITASRGTVDALCNEKHDFGIGIEATSGPYSCHKADGSGFISCDANGDCEMGVPNDGLAARDGAVVTGESASLPPERN